MGKVAEIAKDVLENTVKSEQQNNIGQANASQASSISNAQNNSPDIKSAEVKGASDTPKSETPKTESSEGGGMDWEKLANVASQLGNVTNNSTPAPITVNTISQANPLANFR